MSDTALHSEERMVRRIMWRRLDQPGHEISGITRHAAGWELAGTALFLHEGHPCRLEYRVAYDPAWQTKGAIVSGEIGNRSLDLDIMVDEQRRWWINGEERPAIAGCADIDLGFSPSTNLLPIRRLALRLDQEQSVRAAWLSFPGCEFEVLPQTYRRVGDHAYRYASDGGRFVRMLEVNDAGFVTRYPGQWEELTA